MAENHFTIGGLNSAVSETLTEAGIGVPYGIIGVKDRFGEVGRLDELLESFELTGTHIAAKAREILKK